MTLITLATFAISILSTSLYAFRRLDPEQRASLLEDLD